MAGYNGDLSASSIDDDIIIEIPSSPTEKFDKEHLKLKFKLASIDEIDNAKKNRNKKQERANKKVTKQANSTI